MKIEWARFRGRTLIKVAAGTVVDADPEPITIDDKTILLRGKRAYMTEPVFRALQALATQRGPEPA